MSPISKNNFIAKVTQELLDNNFSVLLYNVEKLEDNCGGYCWIDDDIGKREFAVAMKHHIGFDIFVHEYCHFLQWKNDREFWNSSLETYDILFNWILDKNFDFDEKDLQKSLKDIITLEHDCEKRVLNLVKNNPIENFDTDKSIRAINAYLWSYHINKELRQRPDNPIYSEKILPYMPNVFNENVSYYLDINNLSPEMRQALEAEYETDSSEG